MHDVRTIFDYTDQCEALLKKRRPDILHERLPRMLRIRHSVDHTIRKSCSNHMWLYGPWLIPLTHGPSPMTMVLPEPLYYPEPMTTIVPESLYYRKKNHCRCFKPSKNGNLKPKETKKIQRAIGTKTFGQGRSLTTSNKRLSVKTFFKPRDSETQRTAQGRQQIESIIRGASLPYELQSEGILTKRGDAYQTNRPSYVQPPSLSCFTVSPAPLAAAFTTPPAAASSAGVLPW